MNIKSLALCLFLSISVFSAPVSFEEALQVAENAKKNKKLKLKHKSVKKRGISAVPQGIAPASASIAAEEALFYVFQSEEGNGFVIVAGDDVFKPIIGITGNGVYDSLNMPPNFAWYLENIEKEMAWALENGQAQTPLVAEEWLAFASGAVYAPGTNLIKTKWNQGVPYNNKTPAINGQQTVTGCVATTMAQIMNYHQHPKGAMTGTIPAYLTSDRLAVSSVNLNGLAFDWGNMLNEYGSHSAAQADAVANLMAVAGKSVEMNYGINGSAAFSERVVFALKGYFGYDFSIRHITRGANNAEWENTLKDQIELGLPVYYAGTDEIYGGHAFVLDGYDSGNRFHINWGWGGYLDGFFTIAVGSGLSPLPNNYSQNQRAIINIKPNAGSPAPSGTLQLYSASENPIDLFNAENGNRIQNKTIYQGSPVAVKLGLFNNSPSNEFFGKIIITLENQSRTEVIGERILSILHTGYYGYYDFYTPKINSYAGNYVIAVYYESINGQKLLMDRVNDIGENPLTGVIVIGEEPPNDPDDPPIVSDILAGSLDFGEADLGYGTMTRNAILTNTSEVPLTELAAKIKSGSNAVFEIISSIPNSLRAGASATITIRLKRSLKSGDYADELAVTSKEIEVGKLPIVFKVKGDVPAATAFNPALLVFDEARLGYGTQTKSVVFTNTGADATGLEAKIKSGSNAVFEIISSFPSSLRADASATITLRIKRGLAPGTYRDELIISDKSLPLEFRVADANGNVPDLNPPTDVFNVDEILFADAEPGYGTQTRSVIFRNTSAVSLEGLSAAIENGNAVFEIISSFPSSLRAGTAAAITVRVKRGLKAEETYEDNLIVYSNGTEKARLPISFTVYQNLPVSAQNQDLAHSAEIIAEKPETVSSINIQIVDISQNTGIRIYNLRGNLIAKSEAFDNIQVFNLAPGVYIVKGKNLNKKVVVK
ncbi:MAG: C10 family peptidase [Fibromonadaceae bacterium]|jgi:hypothetical protein|nr:C10 family peptidase [Fibromonadaceae bacterium]